MKTSHIQNLRPITGQQILCKLGAPVRFAEKVQRDPKTRCWNWTGATHSPARYPEKRYGEFALGRTGGKLKVVGAHRFAYELANGPLLTGLALDVDHKCHNPLCVNPKHLRAITHFDNLRLRRDRSGQ